MYMVTICVAANGIAHIDQAARRCVPRTARIPKHHTPVDRLHTRADHEHVGGCMPSTRRCGAVYCRHEKIYRSRAQMCRYTVREESIVATLAWGI